MISSLLLAVVLYGPPAPAQHHPRSVEGRILALERHQNISLHLGLQGGVATMTAGVDVVSTRLVLDHPACDDPQIVCGELNRWAWTAGGMTGVKMVSIPVRLGVSYALMRWDPLGQGVLISWGVTLGFSAAELYAASLNQDNLRFLDRYWDANEQPLLYRPPGGGFGVNITIRR